MMKHEGQIKRGLSNMNHVTLPTQCDDGLVCFQRGPGQAVPGCNGGSNDRSNS